MYPCMITVESIFSSETLWIFQDRCWVAGFKANMITLSSQWCGDPTFLNPIKIKLLKKKNPLERSSRHS